jgi:hypothetical protein
MQQKCVIKEMISVQLSVLCVSVVSGLVVIN